MTVFSMWDPDAPLRSVDLFVEEPIDFDELWERSVIVDIDGTPARVASITDLIRLKRVAGRPVDLEDIAALEEIRSGRHERTRRSGPGARLGGSPPGGARRHAEADPGGAPPLAGASDRVRVPCGSAPAPLARRAHGLG